MTNSSDPRLPPAPTRPRSRLERSGLTPSQERWFNLSAGLLVGLFTLGWGCAIAVSVEHGSALNAARRLASDPVSPPRFTFLMERAARGLGEYRGESGEVRVVILDSGSEGFPDTLAGDIQVELEPAGEARPGRAGGVWSVLLRLGERLREVPDLNVISLVPLSETEDDGRLGEYLLGEWPAGPGGSPPGGRGEAYAPPRGVVEVTRENRHLRVSKHFRLGDFLTKGQEEVWPKYLVLSPRLLDKLELTVQELERMGHPVERVGVISGFRTPYYNLHGGDTSGRGALSRHMYGDAADIYLDNDGDGCMDDLTGDGQVTGADARVIAEAAGRVEERYPALVGGIGVYDPTGAHCGMTHIDTRGTRARW